MDLLTLLCMGVVSVVLCIALAPKPAPRKPDEDWSVDEWVTPQTPHYGAPFKPHCVPCGAPMLATDRVCSYCRTAR